MSEMTKGTDGNVGNDFPDGFLHKKKKKKDKTPPDTVTKEDEEAMVMKRLLELETQLMSEKSEKRDLDSEIIGLKTELTALEKNYKELEQKSTQSLEEFQKFELEDLSSKIETLKKEKDALILERDAAADRESAKIKEIEYAKKEINAKNDEIEDLKGKVDHLQGKEETTLKAEKLQEKESTEGEDVEFLRKKLEQIVNERDKEKASHLKTTERLASLIEDRNMREADFKLEMAHLETDLAALKKDLVSVTKDKEMIWSKLLTQLQLKSTERWILDKESNKCTNCKEVFKFTLRKHHCRLCGHIFCYQCANRWLLTPHHSKRVRTCDVCADAYNELHANAENRDTTDGSEGDSNIIQYRELKDDEIDKFETDDLSDTEDKKESS